LGKWAESLNMGEEFHLPVFKAYFVDGLNIAKIPVLVEIAEWVGRKGAKKVISNRTFKEAGDWCKEGWPYECEYWERALGT
jgi:predicted DsbA family dithiol-disulfide isomerase